jgi:cation diffusion facilitator CzcD-associated flavoprotein CzcO
MPVTRAPAGNAEYHYFAISTKSSKCPDVKVATTPANCFFAQVFNFRGFLVFYSLSVQLEFVKMTRTGPHVDVDAVVIGGGFGGCNSLYKLRRLGLSVKLIEAGSGFGGVWHWNRYPGARVDTEMPSYQFNIPAVYKGWNWSERFPGDEELRAYFQHVDNVLDLSKDTFFNTIVNNVRYDTATARWNVQTESGLSATCKYLIAATGSSHKKHYPAFNGLDNFRGKLVHAADYPESLDLKGKRVGVVGNGASGLQIVQNVAKEDCDLKVFIRTPCFAIPMKQRQISPEEAEMMKGYYDGIFERNYKSTAGFPHNTIFKSAHQATPEERKELFDELWERGGYSFLVSNYYDFLLDEGANSIFYDYWVQKVRARMTNPEKMDLVAPLKQQMLIGTKRPSLEQDYYEMIDRSNVTLHNLKKFPILEFDATGMVTSDGKTTQHHDLDVVIFATGYDAVTGSLLDLAISDKNQVPLSEKWKNGVLTHLGMMVPDTPNLFIVYGPQAPTSLANGPPFIEMEVDWVYQVIEKMQKEGLSSIEPTQAAAEAWRDEVHAVSQYTLYPKADSWYMGSNIPGKRREPLVYLGGMQRWWKSCKAGLESWQGFSTSS